MIYKEETPSIRPRRERRFPPGSLLLALLLMALPVRAELEQGLVAAATERLTQHARLQQWLPYQSDIIPWLPAGAAHLPDCGQPPLYQPAQPDAEPWGRIPYLIQCQDQPGWSIRARVKVQVRLPVWVAAEPLQRDQHVTPANLQLKSMAIHRLHRGFFGGREAPSQRLLRDLPTGKPLYPGLLAPVWLVQKNEQVVIEAVGESFSVSTKGLALGNGSEGDMIPVRNLDSDKRIQAQVVAEHRVRTLH